jgi:hypothetical protein
MRIVNSSVLADLDKGTAIRLNLGSGQRQIAGFYNVDRVPLAGVDIVADLNEPLHALPDDCVESIHCHHSLEHIERLLELIAEIHRIAKPSARVEIVVPHFSNPYGYSDPTHVRFFGLYSFYYFCDHQDQPRRKVPNFYLPHRFVLESVRCRLLAQSVYEKILRAALEPVINRDVSWLDWYERRLCRWLPANDMRFVLRVKKERLPNTSGVPVLPAA